MTSPHHFPAPVKQQILDLPASKIREVSRIVMDRSGGMGKPGVIPLWFGESDQPTPDFIKRAAAEALEAGQTFYTPNRGIPELREACADYMSALYDRPIHSDRVTVSASGMNAIIIVMQCLIEPGDNAVTVDPLWPNIRETVHIQGGSTRAQTLDVVEGRWHLDMDALKSKCDEHTRAVIINSPGNPTGWMMTADQQRELLDFCRERGIWIVADEVYARLTYDTQGRDKPHAPSFLEVAGAEDPVIVINSFSKSWAMTGWRLGWITAPAAMGDVLEKMNEFNIAGPTTFVQFGGVAALKEGEGFIRSMVADLARARALVCDRLAAMDRVRLVTPDAAFYAFFRVEGMEDSLAFAKKLLAETGVGLAPGAAFGDAGEGYLRLCFASSLPLLEEAMDRLAPVLSGK